MTTKSRFKSDAMEAIHGAARGMYESGAMEKETMRRFDARCLVAPAYEAAQIKALREANHVSQPVFARHLNISASTVKQWETGSKSPSGAALKLLSVVEKHGLKALA